MNRIEFERLLLTRMKRRNLLVGAGSLLGTTVISQFPNQRLLANPRFSNNPFTLGVASGDPLPDSVVLWTRLAPSPLNGGGMPPENYSVRWQIALDEKMQRVVQKGSVIATPEFGHSVHVDVKALQPGRTYWYQFKVGNEISPIGRTRTAPAIASQPKELNFAFASCSDWQNGYFTAYANMAKENLDLVAFLGDYIYEYGPLPGGPRQHNTPEITSLNDYRNRYALYKGDPNLQAAHAAFPWIVTWDDHEVENNYANDISELDTEPDQARKIFLLRRAAAYQAYYEHMPLRPPYIPRGSNMLLYRRLSFGNLAQFHVLDTRQYRTDQPCEDGIKQRCPEALAESATLMGGKQERWLFEGLDRSKATWNVIAQQTMMGQYNFDPRSTPTSNVFNLDQWDGYVAARRRLLSHIAQFKPNNPVVITGDIHSSWVHDLKVDFNQPNSPTVATEFVGTSISSDFPPSSIPSVQAALPGNPHTKYFDGAKRGYVRCKLTPDRWQTDFRVVDSVSMPMSAIRTAASFVVENGRPGAKPM
ncbi:MAG: alkaline phosphatase [Alkalinema sp. RU_4_3]|nr:alkaline phosphatase [Alkalinema sp. RU_4_3]